MAPDAHLGAHVKEHRSLLENCRRATIPENKGNRDSDFVLTSEKQPPRSVKVTFVDQRSKINCSFRTFF